MRNITVYRHIRLDKNEVFYIGIGKGDRAYQDKSRSQFWNRVANKTDYRVDVLFDDLTWEEACEKEKEFIALYGRRDIGTGTLVNLTDGGEGALGYKHTKKSKELISLGRKGLPSKRKGIKLPKQHAAKIKKSRSGSGAGKKQRPVLQLDGNGKVLCRYNSISHAAKMVSGFQSAISACCKGRVKTHKGFKWECE
jgi:hypothetical protein